MRLGQVYCDREDDRQALACYCEALSCLTDSQDKQLRNEVLEKVDEQAMKLKGTFMRSY